jgi:hypothetical protein
VLHLACTFTAGDALAAALIAGEFFEYLESLENFWGFFHEDDSSFKDRDGKDARELFERSTRFCRNVINLSPWACKEPAEEAGVLSAI